MSILSELLVGLPHAFRMQFASVLAGVLATQSPIIFPKIRSMGINSDVFHQPGLPIPFTELFQLCSTKMFRNESGDLQSLGTVMTQV
jgi:hypothetical protein